MLEFIKNLSFDEIKYYLSLVINILAIVATIYLSIYSRISKNTKCKSNKTLFIMSQLPVIINKAESLLGSNGPGKIDKVLNEIKTKCLEDDLLYNEEYWRLIVESILTTPQKKYNKENEDEKINEKI